MICEIVSLKKSLCEKISFINHTEALNQLVNQFQHIIFNWSGIKFQEV